MLNEKAVQDALRSAASRYAEFVKAASNRVVYPVQRGNPDSADLRRVTISCHDTLSLPENEDMLLRLATRPRITRENHSAYNRNAANRVLYRAKAILNSFIKESEPC